MLAWCMRPPAFILHRVFTLLHFALLTVRRSGVRNLMSRRRVICWHPKRCSSYPPVAEIRSGWIVLPVDRSDRLAVRVARSRCWSGVNFFPAPATTVRLRPTRLRRRVGWLLSRVKRWPPRPVTVFCSMTMAFAQSTAWRIVVRVQRPIESPVVSILLRLN